MSNSHINSYALEHNPVASEEIGILGGVAHKMTQTAEYLGTVLFRGREIGNFTLNVTAEGATSQVDVDLFSFFPELPKAVTPSCCPDEQADSQNRIFTMAKDSYLVLFASEGPPGYRVTLDRLDPDERVRVYDTRELKRDDIFFMTLLRPGTYTFTCHSGQVVNGTVTYPVVGEDPFVPQEPRLVDLTAAGFSGGEITLQPAQGVVFNIQADNAWVRAELTAPNNGPGDGGPVRWNNPLNQ